MLTFLPLVMHDFTWPWTMEDCLILSNLITCNLLSNCDTLRASARLPGSSVALDWLGWGGGGSLRTRVVSLVPLQYLSALPGYPHLMWCCCLFTHRSHQQTSVLRKPQTCTSHCTSGLYILFIYLFVHPNSTESCRCSIFILLWNSHWPKYPLPLPGT